MDNDLDRSVRLLEDALSTSGRGLFKANLLQKRSDKDNRLDLSLTMAPHELRRLLEANNHSVYDETIASILHDKTVTGSVVQANTPWKTTVDSLYTEFFEVLQSHSGGHDILEVVSDLSRCCSDALKVVAGLKSKVSLALGDQEKWLENERNTWRLLFILYQDRLLSQNVMDEEIIQYCGRSEKLCVQNLFKRDCLVRESQLVIDWLECNAADKDDEVLHFSDSTVGWENTLHQLQSASTIAFSSSRQIVDKMDADAPHYLNRPLHDLDVEDEKRLSHKIFTEIRCGKLEEAEKLCRQSGHAWRAALFEGWRLYHNPNIKENYENDAVTDVDDGYEEMPVCEQEEIEGNSNRDIWKAMAMKYCKQDWLGAYERAAVGAFCGYIEPILPVCQSWEDNLWAYMKSIVDIRVESEVRDCCIRNESYIPLSDEYWAQKMSLNEVFSYLESSKNRIVREESKQPEHIIQKYIILDEIPKLIDMLEDWVEDPTVTTQFLRFATHLVLFLEQIGQAHNRSRIEKVIEVYIKRLMEMKETQLVAFYVSKLSASSQIQFYAMYLENITDLEERKTSLMYAEDSCLDVYAITKQVVENIRSRPHEVETTGNLQHKLTDADNFKISALDWLNFYDIQRLEVLRQSNALIFTFLTLGKVDAAQLAYNKVPSDAVEKVVHDGNDNPDVHLTIKEHLSYRAYLSACDSFNEWFMQCKNKPVPPAEPHENAQFPEKVAYQHRVSQHKAELERWKLMTAHLSKTAKTLLYNVLLFPEGWLVGATDADYLRSTCIPEVVLLLYSVLFESGVHEECVQLADIIAAEKHQLYKVYSKEKLGEILVKLCESSVALLNAKKDPWGNETSA